MRCLAMTMTLSPTYTLRGYRGLLDAETRRLTNEESALYIQLFFIDKNGGSVQVFDDALGRSRSLGIAKGRMEWADIPYDPAALLWISQLATTPGELVMWCYTLHAIAQHTGHVAAGLDEWTDFFAWGVPTEAGCVAAWDAQKHPAAPAGNLLDDNKLWP